MTYYTDKTILLDNILEKTSMKNILLFKFVDMLLKL